MYPYLRISEKESADAPQREDGGEPQRPDIISTLAAIGVPTLVVFRLLTGGWTTLAFMVLIFACVSLVYWRLEFFDDGE